MSQPKCICEKPLDQALQGAESFCINCVSPVCKACEANHNGHETKPLGAGNEGITKKEADDLGERLPILYELKAELPEADHLLELSAYLKNEVSPLLQFAIDTQIRGEKAARLVNYFQEHYKEGSAKSTKAIWPAICGSIAKIFPEQKASEIVLNINKLKKALMNLTMKVYSLSEDSFRNVFEKEMKNSLEAKRRELELKEKMIIDRLKYLKDKLNKADETFEKKKKDMGEFVRGKISDAEEKMAKLNCTCADLSSDAHRANIKFETVRAQKLLKVKELTIAGEHAQKRLSALQAYITGKESDYKTLIQTIEKQKQENSSLNVEKKNLEEDIRKLKDEKMARDAELKIVENKKQSEERNIDEKKKNLAELEKQKKDRGDEIERLNKIKASLESSNKELEDKKISLNTDIQGLEGTKQSAEKELASLEEKATLKSCELKNIKQEIEAAKKEVST